MKRQQGKFLIVISLLVVIILSVTVSYTIIDVNGKMQEYCFSDLSATSENLAKDLYNSTKKDKTILSAMAEIIAFQKDTGDENIVSIMDSFVIDDTYISYIELLDNQNRLISSDGETSGADNYLDFAKEKLKGEYISETSNDAFSEGKVIRNAVPVKKNNETIAMLYGVINLEKLAQIYTADIYDGNAYVYLEDGTTGDFLLDTWHKKLGNIIDFRNRETLEGYDFNTATQEMRKGTEGNLVFVSNTNGNTVYLHYTPTGINNWNVLVSIDKNSAFKESVAISSKLYFMALVIVIVLLAYLGLIVFSVLNAYRTVRRISAEDLTTTLQNRNSYDKYVESVSEKKFDSFVCIYIDGNGLHEINNRYGHAAGDKMLTTVADSLKGQFEYNSLYRIGGDEFVVLCENCGYVECEKKLLAAVKRIESEKYSVSYGISYCKNETGIDRIIKEADEKMLKYKADFYTRHHDRRKMRK